MLQAHLSVPLPALSVRKWFLRAVYRNATPADLDGRSAYLDGIDDVVLRQITQGGKRLVSASSTGSQASYEFAEGLELEDLASLTEWARGYIGEGTIEEAIALVPAGVKYLSADFSGLRH